MSNKVHDHKNSLERRVIAAYRKTLKIPNSVTTWQEFVRSMSAQTYNHRFNYWVSGSQPKVIHDGMLYDLVGKQGYILRLKLANTPEGFPIIDVHYTKAMPYFVNALSKDVINALMADASIVEQLTKHSGLEGTETGRLNTNKPNKTNTPKTSEQENKTMSKVTNVVDANKKAAKELAYLNAGRVANKTVKEAMRPLLALVVKPNFVQRTLMKLTGTKDPVAQFLDSPVSDLVAAEVFKLLLEVRGVEDKHVQETADKALVYAGLKVTEKFPVEDLMDSAISQVADTVKATSVLQGKV